MPVLTSSPRPFPDSPLVVAYGLGVDSTAMLIEFADRAIRPDLILFADTGGEKPETYQYLAVLRPFHTWRSYASRRGMAPYRDLVDWVGGYPFEVATPEAIFDFYRDRGFVLEKLGTCGGSLGCNQFVFRRAC